MPDITPFRARRAALLERMGAGIAIVPTSPERIRNRDSDYPYRFDTSAVSVEVIHGGTASSLRAEQPGLHAVDIVLTRPLRSGGTASFEYVTRFAYPYVPAPQFRRAAFSPVDNLDIRVRFSPEALPASIQWCVWKDLGDATVLEETRRVPGGDAVEITVE